MLPILSDPGNSAYIREEAGKIMVGCSSVGQALGNRRHPGRFSLRRDSARLGPHVPLYREGDAARPSPLETGIKLLFCGPESFTPDHNYLMGEAPNLEEFFVAAGFNSLGILSGGGVGFVMAHWIASRGARPWMSGRSNLRRTHRVAGQRPLFARSRDRVARHRLSGPLAVPAARDRARA
jgi:glycine/D-amino acid oxidase-like deaminating enzyme